MEVLIALVVLAALGAAAVSTTGIRPTAGTTMMATMAARWVVMRAMEMVGAEMAAVATSLEPQEYWSSCVVVPG